MSKKKKYYVVWKGHQPGIYDSWPVAKSQIENFPNARYKGYPTLDAAKTAFKEGWQTAFQKSNKPVEKAPFVKKSISVDAASSGNPGIVEYQGVWTHDKSLIFQDRKSTRLNSSHVAISYAVFCLKKKKKIKSIIAM